MIHIMFAICSALWIYGSFYAKVKILSQPTRNKRLVISESTCLQLMGVRQRILTPLAPSLHWDIGIHKLNVKRAPEMPIFITDSLYFINSELSRIWNFNIFKEDSELKRIITECNKWMALHKAAFQEQLQKFNFLNLFHPNKTKLE